MTERKNSAVARVKSALTKHAAMRIGLGLFFCWFWAITQNAVVGPVGIAHDGGFDPLWAATLATGCATFLAVSYLYRSGAEAMRLGSATLKISIWHLTFSVLIAYLLLLCFPLLAGIESRAFIMLQALVTGMLFSLLFVQWGTFVGSQEPHEVVICLSIGLIIAAFIGLLLFELERTVALAIISLLPFASAGILLRRTAHLPEQASALAKHPKDDGSSAIYESSFKFFATVFVFGVASGLLYYLFNSVTLEKCNDPFCVLRFINGFFPNVSSDELYSVIGAAGLAIAALIMLVASSILRLNFRKLIYVVGFPLMALGFLVISFDPGLKLAEAVSHASGVNFTAGQVLSIAGFYYVIAVSWALCSYLTRTGKEDAFLMFARTGAALSGGRTVGYLSSQLFGFASVSRADSCIITLFTLMLISLIIVTNDRLWND